ncbi:hypothetical protein LTR10_022225 [Elasticomyces elasticus]|uniref:Uncharacterized protein n=1 Tax=Exophiala sideris TaxID=1016849 RepID=A0ABR0JIJ6_9EURO|nr:hypothetical protein LTR10_022225 [Elasticomyces elasticus]KAK5034403.1 hypothetical protein LTS07_003324 [Exophiala sideris]KAK5042700.1 hypothetical protein LTR13_001548 [Exophiala sideris]KAK5065782.1 hypothetical protein LTR69_003332 [Exophiala sideris]KAK5185758.1 hypothetical protein LTR44_001807 [Eurotiomycetes sp. CCFEE 6388]
MAQQHPYNQAQQFPSGQYQYPPQQQQLYPPYQGNSRPPSPYQQPAQAYQPPGYAPQQPPSRTPSPYAQNLYHQQPPPGYQGYTPPQGYTSQGYPPPQAQSAQPPYQQYTSPPLRPQTQQGPYTLIFAPSAKHTKTLTPQGSSQSSYVVHYNRPLIASTRPDITITSGSGGQLATAEWHTWSGKIDLTFTSGNTITYKDNFESSTLGRLFWTMTQGNKKQADIKCADRTGQAVCTVVLRDKLETGRIEIWRHDLSRQEFDEIVVSAIAEIEDLRRKMEDSGVNYGVIGAVAAINC